MGQSVEVVVSELNSASVRLADAGQRLQDGLSRVDLEVGQLLGSGWKRGAASAFGGEWDKWHSGAGQVVRGLQTMSDLLRIAGREYAKTDEHAAGALGSSMQAPGGSGAGASGGGVGGGAATTSANGPGVAELAQQMNLTNAAPASGGPAAAGQSTQLAGGPAQQTAALAQRIVELAQQGDDGTVQRQDPAVPAPGEEQL